jgi:hypothetical protein
MLPFIRTLVTLSLTIPAPKLKTATKYRNEVDMLSITIAAKKTRFTPLARLWPELLLFMVKFSYA